MSYNIKHGEGMDNVLNLSRAADIIKVQAPDLCALQEVDHYCLRSDSLGQTEFLAKATDMTGTFGAFMNFDGGEYGMATLSAKPLKSSKVLPLPDGLSEPRCSIINNVQIDEACAVTFVNVHFDWIVGEEGVSSRIDQAEALMQYLNTINNAIIITGDFNCTPDSPTMQYLAKQGFEFADKGTDNLSFQGAEKVEIDHVIFRNSKTEKINVKQIRLLDEPLASDHRPLIAELEVVY